MHRTRTTLKKARRYCHAHYRKPRDAEEGFIERPRSCHFTYLARNRRRPPISCYIQLTPGLLEGLLIVSRSANHHDRGTSHQMENPQGMLSTQRSRCADLLPVPTSVLLELLNCYTVSLGRPKGV